MARTLRKKQEPTGAYTRMVRTTCGNCPTGCGLKVFLDHHGLVDIFGDEEHPTNKGSICPKGMLSLRHLANPTRLRLPQIRKKLSEPYRQVSWPEALDFILGRLELSAARSGRQAVHILGAETDPFAYTAGATWFAAHYGAGSIPAQFYPAGLGEAGAVQRMFGVAGQRMLMNTPRDWAASNCILIFRSDLAATDPISAGPVLDARDRGVPLMVIDSKKNMTTSRASCSLIVRPGSEATALKGIIHLLLKDKRVNQEFLSEWTDGIVPLVPLVSSCDPASVAAQCGVSQEEFLRLADLLGKNSRSLQVIAGDWASRGSLSDEELSLCGALVALTGSVGIPGGGLNLLCNSPFNWAEMLKQPADGSQPLKDYHASLCLPKLLTAGKPPVEALFCHGNLYPRLGGGEAVREAWGKIDLVVHLGAYPCETHHRAHVSLPMSSWLECEGLLATSNGRALQWHHQVVDPPEQCRSPLEFWTELALGCNLGEFFPWVDQSGGIDHGQAANFFLQRCPLTRAASVDLLDPETNPPGGLLWPCVEDKDLAFEDTHFIKGNVRGPNILFQRRLNFPDSGQRFPSPSGRVSFAGQGSVSQPEVTLSSDQHHPLILIIGALVDYVPEFGFFVSNRPPQALSPMVKLHPQLGRLLGIRRGDLVVVENDLGSFTGPAWPSDEVSPGTLWCPEGVDPHQPHFVSPSPQHLFPLQPGASCRASRTAVTLYPQGGDRERSRGLLLDFLTQLQQEPPLGREKIA